MLLRVLNFSETPLTYWELPKFKIRILQKFGFIVIFDIYKRQNEPFKYDGVFSLRVKIRQSV